MTFFVFIGSVCPPCVVLLSDSATGVGLLERSAESGLSKVDVRVPSSFTFYKLKIGLQVLEVRKQAYIR